MKQCTHSPKVPFFVLFKTRRGHNAEEKIQFKCKKCGQIIVPKKHLSRERFDFGVRFIILCIYILFVRDWLFEAFQSISILPNIVIHLFTAISGGFVSALMVDILLFFLLHGLKWKLQ